MDCVDCLLPGSIHRGGRGAAAHHSSLPIPSARPHPSRSYRKRSRQKKGGRGRRDEELGTWNDVRWVIDRSDRQFAELGRSITGQFQALDSKIEAQGAKLESKMEAQGKEISEVKGKISRAEVAAGVMVGLFIFLNVFFKDGVRVLEALLRLARGD
jgi:hypothetical protein